MDFFKWIRIIGSVVMQGRWQYETDFRRIWSSNFDHAHRSCSPFYDEPTACDLMGIAYPMRWGRSLVIEQERSAKATKD